MIQNQGESEETVYQRIENIIRTALQEEKLTRNRNLEYQRKVDALSRSIEQVTDQRNEELNSCQEKLNGTNQTIGNLEKIRNQDICMWRYWISIAIQSACIVLIIISGSRYIFIDINKTTTWSDFIDQNIGLIITGYISILSFIAGGAVRLSILRPIRAHKKHREELFQEWNDDNPEYSNSIQEKTNLLTKIANLKSEIDIPKNQN